jgi:hypothetical protein
MKNQSEKTENPFAAIADLSTEIISGSKDLNNVLATGSVKFAFRTHYVNSVKGIAGIEQLIRDILRRNGSVFPRDSHKGEQRESVIAGAMFAREIEAKVKLAFGKNRYPRVTLRVYLATRMQDVCTVQLTKWEDTTGKKPRAKYYLAE